MLEERSLYPICEYCNTMMIPVWFIDHEFIKNIPTGRKRKACSYFTCPNCLNNETVDDSFDGSWY